MPWDWDNTQHPGKYALGAQMYAQGLQKYAWAPREYAQGLGKHAWNLREHALDLWGGSMRRVEEAMRGVTESMPGI